MGCKVATGNELVLLWLAEMTSVHRQEGAGGSGAPTFADFSSFRERIREKREAA